MDHVVLGNPVSSWILFALILGIAVAVSLLIRFPVLGFLQRHAERTATDLDDFIIAQLRRNMIPVLLTGSLWLSCRVLVMAPVFDTIIEILGIVMLVFFSTRFLSALMGYWISHRWPPEASDSGKASRARGLVPALNVLLWTLGILFLLDNLGLDLTTLVAGLGIGGVAVALGAQVILKDLFGYASLLMDRPFSVGDTIIAGDLIGTVERIGLKTTRIRNLAGDELILPNSFLTDNRVQNFRSLKERRIVMNFDVEYGTPARILEKIPSMLEEAVSGSDHTRFDRAHLKELGASGIGFELVWYVTDPDYAIHMDIRQEINLKVLKGLESLGASLAYPTTAVVVRKGATG